MFGDCYAYIQQRGYVLAGDIDPIKSDLAQLLLTLPRLETSRAKVATAGKPVDIDGETVKLNAEFVEVISLVSGQLNLDEVETALLLLAAQPQAHARGVTLGDAGYMVYYQRYQLIVEIVTYLISSRQLALIGVSPEKLLETALLSFTKIYTLLAAIDAIIDKQKVTDNLTDLLFIESVRFQRHQLWDVHEKLATLLFVLIDVHHELATATTLTKLVNHIKSLLADNDLEVLHYLPAVLAVVTRAFSLDAATEAIQKHIVSILGIDQKNTLDPKTETVDLGKSKLMGFELVVYITFLTKFIGWCKDSDTRTRNYNFRGDILCYIEQLISYGVMEVFLSYGAETAVADIAVYGAYDFRGLLQRQYPRLVPAKFTYPGAGDLLAAAKNIPALLPNIKLLVDVDDLKVSNQFSNDIIMGFFHLFFCDFVGNAAIVLTSLRDNEEDFLLASKQEAEARAERPLLEAGDGDHVVAAAPVDYPTYDLDTIATKLELERFYLAFTYVYTHRAGLAQLLWENEDDIVGFISWGLKNNTLLLISATFCMLMGLFALALETVAVKLWDILVENNHGLKKHDYLTISVDLITDSLMYYAASLQESVESDVNEQLRWRQKRLEALFLRPRGDENGDSSPTIVEYAEDAVVFILGFVLLLLLIMNNLGPDHHPRLSEIRTRAFERLSPVVIDFLALDNVTTALSTVDASLSSKQQLPMPTRLANVPRILVSQENKIVVSNLMLNLLRAFAHGTTNLALVHRVWDLVDRWVFHSLAPLTSKWALANAANPGPVQPKRPSLLPSRKIMSTSQGFVTTITLYSQAVVFVELVGELLRQEACYQSKLQLRFPVDLGVGYRPHNLVGIWPYIEFLVQELLVKLGDLDENDSRYLQQQVLGVLLDAVNLVDWTLYQQIAPEAIPKGINFDNVVDNQEALAVDWVTYVKSHQGVAVLSSLFDGKPFAALCNLIALGNNADNLEVVNLSVNLLNKVLYQEPVFLNKLVLVVKKGELATGRLYDLIYIPYWIGTAGVNLFGELLSFNLSAVVMMALYVGSGVDSLAEALVEVLEVIAKSPAFHSAIPSLATSTGSPPLLHSNRLLTAFVNVDELPRIIAGFISQFCDITNDGATGDGLRFKILKFLASQLAVGTSARPSVAHFLLGYHMLGDLFVPPTTTTSTTLLECLLNYLKFNLALLGEVYCGAGNIHVITHLPAQFALMCLQIIVTLASDPVTGVDVLGYIRNIDSSLFESVVASLQKVDDVSLWSDVAFDGNLDIDHSNTFIDADPAATSLIEFIHFRTAVVKFLALEIAAAPLASTKEFYIDMVNTSPRQLVTGRPRVLGLLDIFNYTFANFDSHGFEHLASDYHVPVLAKQINVDSRGFIDILVVDKVVAVENQSKVAKPLVLMIAPSARPVSMAPTVSNLDRFMARTPKPYGAVAALQTSSVFYDALLRVSLLAVVPVSPASTPVAAPPPQPSAAQLKISPMLKRFYILVLTRSSQLDCLRWWCQLIESVFRSDPSNASSAELILQVFEATLPKINDYLEGDVAFSEQLVGLSVVLFNHYDRVVMAVANHHGGVVARLLPLFSLGIAGILNLNLSPGLRSDWYVLCTKFLSKAFGIKELEDEARKVVSTVTKRLVLVVANDAISSEGPLRVTLLIFLESLVHLSSRKIVEELVHTNSLQMLVMLMKRTDDMMQMATKHQQGVSLANLVFELVAFKATVYLLVRVGQHKHGALCLIQLEIYAVLLLLSILKVDPDLGMGLIIDDSHDDVHIDLIIDTPVRLADVMDKSTPAKVLSLLYLELLVPIFQLAAAVLVLMGPNYKPSISLTKTLMSQCHPLVVGVMKRQYLMETLGNSDAIKQMPDLEELVKLFTLLDSLTKGSS